MRFVPTRFHAVIDYLVGIVLIGFPFAFGWAGSARWTLIGLGVFAIFYSLCTDYELGVFPILGLRTHLVLDFIFAAILLALPWMQELPAEVRVLLWVIGVSALLLVATTNLRTSARLRMPAAEVNSVPSGDIG